MWLVLEENIALVAFEEEMHLENVQKLNLTDSGRTVICEVVPVKHGNRVIRILSTKEQIANKLNELKAY